MLASQPWQPLKHKGLVVPLSIPQLSEGPLPDSHKVDQLQTSPPDLEEPLVLIVSRAGRLGVAHVAFSARYPLHSMTLPLLLPVALRMEPQAALRVSLKGTQGWSSLSSIWSPLIRWAALLLLTGEPGRGSWRTQLIPDSSPIGTNLSACSSLSPRLSLYLVTVLPMLAYLQVCAHSELQPPTPAL